jgi:hypothetical protein
VVSEPDLNYNGDVTGWVSLWPVGVGCTCGLVDGTTHIGLPSRWEQTVALYAGAASLVAALVIAGVSQRRTHFETRSGLDPAR